MNLKPVFRAAALGTLCTTIAATNANDTVPTTQNDPNNAQSDITAMYDRMGSLSYLKDAQNQCVSMRHVSQSGTPELQAKASTLLETMDQTELTRRVRDGFAANNGALCFVDFEKEYGASNMTYAMHFTDFDTIIINDSENTDPGCTVSAAIHEMHHGAQKSYGMPAPIRNLNLDNQKDLVMTIEADAHAIQIIGSEMLAQNGYMPAKTCNETVFNDMPHFVAGMDAMNAALADDSDALHNGHAATAVFNAIAPHNDLLRRYGFMVGFYYDCYSYPRECFRGNETLQENGMDLSELSKIHYTDGYVVTPYSTIRSQQQKPSIQP